MIITRTPFRISFFGGGTDYPVYYQQHDGLVLSTTINKYCYITCRYLPPFFDHKFRGRYMRKRELTAAADEFEHPSIRECLKFLEVEDGVEIIHTSDIPAMSGIGSSSSFTVGCLNALHALNGRMVTKRKLAYDAIHVEQDLIGEHVGSQDQVAAAFGGMNKIEFNRNEEIRVHPITIGKEKIEYLQRSLMFFFSGFSRNASEIAREQIETTPMHLSDLLEMKQMVTEAIQILNGPHEDITDFGRLMHDSWMIKRSLTSKISNTAIDDIYTTARKAGALGGKLCGAGGGGFILLFVPPEKQPAVKKALHGLLLVPFRFEQLGSHVIFHSA